MFIITEHQYNLIMKQAQKAYPQETGGFLGGHDNTILGVLPVQNKEFNDPKTHFGLNSDDVERAYHFLVKHKLEYLGVYHTHPSGVPVPSQADLSHDQKYLFIIGLADRYNPDLVAWRVENGVARAEDIKIISDLGVTVVDIVTGKPKLSQNAPTAVMDRLANQIDDLIAGQQPEYPKLNPTLWDESSFSTFA